MTTIVVASDAEKTGELGSFGSRFSRSSAPFGNSTSDTPKRASLPKDSELPAHSGMPYARRRTGNSIGQDDHAQKMVPQTTAAEPQNYPRTAKDSSRHRIGRRWKIRDPAIVENILNEYSISGGNSPNSPSNSSEYPPATPKPIYLVAPAAEEEKNVAYFREPEVVIRSADADMPRHRKLKMNVTGGIDPDYGPGGRKRSPLLGSLRGGPGNCRVYSVRDDVPELVDFAAGVDCVDLATVPTVVVCPYPDDDDHHLSRPLRAHGVWEPHVVRLFQVGKWGKFREAVRKFHESFSETFTTSYIDGSRAWQFLKIFDVIGRHCLFAMDTLEMIDDDDDDRATL